MTALSGRESSIDSFSKPRRMRMVDVMVSGLHGFKEDVQVFSHVLSHVLTFPRGICRRRRSSRASSLSDFSVRLESSWSFEIWSIVMPKL